MDFGTFDVESAAGSTAGIKPEYDNAYETFHFKISDMSMHLLDCYFDWGPGAGAGLGLLAGLEGEWGSERGEGGLSDCFRLLLLAIGVFLIVLRE